MINNILVIGLGSMGKRRIRILKEICPSVCIIGVDKRHDRCKMAQKQYNIKCINDLENGFESKPEAVFVCTSPIYHSEIIKIALQHGCHVFTEINLVADGYDDNIKLAKEKNLVLFLSSTLMYRKEIEYIQQIVSQTDNPINYIYHVGQYLPTWHPEENYSDFFVSDKRTNGCREVFAIELPWLVDVFGEISSITVEKGNMTTLNIGYNDYYIVILKHKNGNNGCLNFNIASQKAVRNFQLYGQDLYFEWGGTPHTISIYNPNKNDMENIKLYETARNINSNNITIIEDAYIEEIIEFFDIIENGKMAKYSFEQDKKILTLIDEIEKE